MAQRSLLLLLAFLFLQAVCAQTKVEGRVVDESGNAVAFANVLFKGSKEGGITNDDGRFYLESDSDQQALLISFIGYQTKEIPLENKVTYGLEITLLEGEQLDEVVLYVGKQAKKNNPAIDILEKVWARKRVNGLHQFDHYKYDKYEKLEFDLNTIDSSLIKSRVFKGLEFIFQDLDTSRITGKTYLPLFLNETFTTVYGNNRIDRERQDLKGSKNSGFSNNQAVIAFVEDLYADYDIYDNYLKFFDKSFTSPLSRAGVDTYNYVLADSAMVDNKWCYQIIYYPRRKNELTFKGDFWVNDTTYAVKKINLELTRSANLNWVKEVYIEQDFEVLSDSVFLLKRDYMLSDFSFSKKEKARGVYGKRTTVYDNYIFNEPEPEAFYRNQSDPYDPRIFERDSSFWNDRRLEALNKDEKGIYALLDTLKTVPRFNTYYNLVSILGSGYVEIDKWNLDLGDVYSTFGYNDAEGIRLRGGARTYFGQNDPWRLEGYLAYGFGDHQLKHGVSAKVLLDYELRLILSGGHRKDVEQLGLSLNSTTDVLGRSVASSAVFTVGSNNTLSNIQLGTLHIEMEPLENLRFRFGGSIRQISSALPEVFNLDYFAPESPDGIASEIRQFDLSSSIIYTPGKKVIGSGVEPRTINDDYSTLVVNYTHGLQGFMQSDFNYQKLQLTYTRPWQLGGFGRLLTTVEAGRTFGTVPLALLNVIPGNQTLFTLYGTFPNLDFYEFVTDTYAAVHLEHNFNGRLLARVPLFRKLNLREIVGLRGVWGQLSAANKRLSEPASLDLRAPEDKIYYEYSIGVGNIFRIFRIDLNFRGNYLDRPGVRPFGITGSFGFSF